MENIKKFFGIETTYRFEWADLTSVITVFNVMFVVLGFWWAPILGLINCGINLTLCVINRSHINMYIMNLALIVLNAYFLTL